jgi:hypothetical protein
MTVLKIVRNVAGGPKARSSVAAGRETWRTHPNAKVRFNQRSLAS